MIFFTFRYFFRYLLIGKYLMIFVFTVFDFNVATYITLLIFLFFQLLHNQFCYLLNNENFWDNKINYLAGISKGRLLNSFNIVISFFSIFSFGVFLLVKYWQYRGFSIFNAFKVFILGLLIAVLVGNIISLKVLKFDKNLFGVKLLAFLAFGFFFSVLDVLFLNIPVNYFVKLVILSFGIVLINYLQLNKPYTYHDCC